MAAELMKKLTRRPRGSLAVFGVGAVLLTGTACSPAAGHVAASSTGVVVGKFIREGGPIGPNGQQPKVVRLHGVIKFVARGKHSVTVNVGGKGTFSVRLRPGTYSVSGRTPQIEQVSADGSGPGQEITCSSSLSVKVTRGHTSKITVTCIVP